MTPAMLCPTCDSENPDGATFCNACGARLDDQPVKEERKVITALFCDLVGSTALGERLDAEEVSRLLRRYADICRRRIESHGGVVEKFIGDAVVGVFGVPSAHEDDPERAVRAALRIVADIVASDLQIQVRIGVNTGPALVRLNVDPRSGEGFATGDALNTAARLEAAAPVMGIAVGAATHDASSAAIVYEELPPIVAKGKANPVPAWRAIRSTSAVRTTDADRTPFVGRDLELNVLLQLFERAKSRPGTEFCTIIADPGMGKSRLLRELFRRLDMRSDGVTWREGRCLPYGDGISFWALGEIVKAEAGIKENDGPELVAAKLDRAVTESDGTTRDWVKDRLAPLVGLRTSSEAPQREEVFTAWRRFIEQLATRGPTVLVIEDLHWADPALVAFLEHLASRSAGLPLLVLVTARPEVDERHPSWPPARRSSVLSLSPLTDGELETLIAHALPDAERSLVGLVLDRAGGSPLYTEQLTAMLDDLEATGAEPDDWVIPSSLQALVAARIDALPANAKQVLMEASVVGRTFWSGALQALGEHDDLTETLNELVRRDLCVPSHPSSVDGDSEYLFWHALVRDVAYEELPLAERASMHNAIAVWLTDRPGESTLERAEIVVHHADAALALEPTAEGLNRETLTEILEGALLTAGQSAMKTEVPNAIPYLERSLQLLGDDDPRRGDVLHLLARAHTATGHPAEAAEILEGLLEHYQGLSDDDGATATAIQLSGILWLMGEGARGDAIVRATTEALADTPGPSLARALAYEAMGRWVKDDFDGGLQGAEEALEVATSARADPPLLALAVRGICRVERGDWAGEADVREAVNGFLAELNPGAACVWIFNLGAASSTMKGPALALDYFDESIALATRFGMTGELWSGRAGRLGSLASLGHFDEVSREAPRVLEWAVAHDDAYSRCMVLLSLARLDEARAEGLVDSNELADLARRMDEWGCLVAAAIPALLSGDDQQARDLLREGSGHAPVGVAASLARMAVDAGEPGIASAFLSRSTPHYPAERAATLAAAATLAEQNGDYGRACDGFGGAIDILMPLGMKPELAFALVGLGRCCLALGKTADGVAHLHQARALWERMSANPRIAEIDHILAGH